jgi:1-phosphofructokinase
MITAVCANPCIDKEVHVDGFKVGGLNRIIDHRSDASGKGINVAIASKRLGAQVACIGFNYHDNGQLEVDRLKQEDIEHEFVYSEGAIRTNTKIIDISNGVMTEVNEAGAYVSPERIASLGDMIARRAKESDFMVFSGSVPKGADKKFYYNMINLAKGTKCVLDCDGELLVEGLKAKPYIIKPNLFELEQFSGRKLQNNGDIVKAGREIIDSGVSIVFVTMGGDGAIILDDKEAYFIPPVDVCVKNTVGAGDSATSGLITALEKGAPLRDAAISGIAAATATVMTEGSLLLRYEDYKWCLGQVRTERL